MVQRTMIGSGPTGFVTTGAFPFAIWARAYGTRLSSVGSGAGLWTRFDA